MKSDEERGRWGAWLRRERLKRGLSPEQVREMLAARGFRVGESSYAEWESGYKQPSRDARPHLIALWGGEPPIPTASSPDAGDLPAAIREQAAVMRELVVELREARQAQQGRDEGLAAVLRQLGDRLEQSRLVPSGKSRSNNG